MNATHPSTAATPRAEINPQALDDFAENFGREGVVDIIDVLVDDAPRVLDGLHGAATGYDAKRVGFYAHTMGSAAATVGAMPLCEQCRRVERMVAAAVDVGQIVAQAATIESGYRSMLSMLASMRRKFAAAAASSAGR